MVLTLTFLGVGSAFSKTNLQSNALIEAWSAGPEKQDSPDDTLLVDFGTTGPLALHQLKSRPGFSYLDHNGVVHYPAISRIFITHQHSDHIGGLEELAIMNMRHRAEAGGTVPPEADQLGHELLQPAHGHTSLTVAPGRASKPQIISAIDTLVNLWDHSLMGGLSVLNRRLAALEDYFDVLAVRTKFTMLDRYEFAIFPTDHIQVQRKYDWASYGLLISDRETAQTVLYSGDTRFDPEGLGEMMAAAKLNFHEVQLEDQADSVHATLSEMRTLPEATRKRTILYHYGDAWKSGSYGFVPDEFAGFAEPQRRYTLFD